KITITYIALSGISTLLLCAVVYFLFTQNNQYYFLKRLQDRAKIVASIHYQNDPVKARYYQELKANGLEELSEEKDYVLRVNSENTFEYNTKLQLPPEFYADVMKKGSGWTVQEEHRYFYAQIFNESGIRYMVIVSAKDKRGNTSAIYIFCLLSIGGLCFIIVAFYFGCFLASRVITPVYPITIQVKRISTFNCHNPLTRKDDSDEK